MLEWVAISLEVVQYVVKRLGDISHLNLCVKKKGGRGGDDGEFLKEMELILTSVFFVVVRTNSLL